MRTKNQPDYRSEMLAAITVPLGNEITGDRGMCHLDPDTDWSVALKKVHTAETPSVSTESIENVCLSSRNKVERDIHRTYGNPTPLGLAGFLLLLSPLVNVLLGWQGSGILGAAETVIYFDLGGLTMILGGLLEFFLGNTLPFIVFVSFGGFSLSLGPTFAPYFNSAIAHQPKEPAGSALTPELQTSFAFFLSYMGLLCLVYLVCALRTNLIFVLIFLSLVPAFFLLAASFWQNSRSNIALSMTLQYSSAGFLLVATLFGWYLFTAQMMASVEFPMSLPVGQLNKLVRGASERKEEKQSARAM